VNVFGADSRSENDTAICSDVAVRPFGINRRKSFYYFRFSVFAILAKNRKKSTKTRLKARKTLY
jgi:hypothetical protein